MKKEGRLRALHPAAGAVEHFRRDGHAVELCPQGGGFLPQRSVIGNGCDSGVAGLTVQPAAAKQLIHIPSSSKNECSANRFPGLHCVLSVWQFDIDDFSVLIANHAGVSAFRAEQREIRQYRPGPHPGSGFAAAFGAAQPIQFCFQSFNHAYYLTCFVDSYIRYLPA